MVYLYCFIIYIIFIPIIAIIKHKYFKDAFATADSYGHYYNDAFGNLLLSALWPLGIIVFPLIGIGFVVVKFTKFMEKIRTI